MTHSPEVFAAYSEIDLGYYSLKMLSESKSLSAEEIRKSSIFWIKHVIKNKKTVEADYSRDVEVLNRISSLHDI